MFLTINWTKSLPISEGIDCLVKVTIVCLNKQPESHPRNKRLQTIHMN